MRERLLCVLVMFGCSKAESREAAPTPKAVAPTAPAPAVAAPPAPAVAAAPSLIDGTRVDWPAGAGRWIAIANRGGALQVVAADATGSVREVTDARFEDEYIEVDDKFRLTAVGANLVVARSSYKGSASYREVLLLAPDPVRVIERWSGLEGESAPFEPSSLRSSDTFTWSRGSITQTFAVETEGTKARLVWVDAAARVQDIAGGTFALDYVADEVSVSFEAKGDRLVARMSTAANVANNCEQLLVAAANGTPRVMSRGACTYE